MALRIVLAAVAALALSPAAHAGDPAAGEQKAAVCAACHGADGNSAAASFPSIAGQHADYLVKQLRDFKSGARENAVMAGQVAALSDQDMADLAAFYATQSAAPASASEDNLALGELIWRGGISDAGVAACMACHGMSGAGMPGAGFPALRGQYAAYTEAQLKAFRDGVRANDANRAMRDIAKRMREEEISAVSNYIQGLN